MSFIRVALDVPLDTLFDYRLPQGCAAATAADIGARVVVPFGRKLALGVIVERMTASQLPAQRIRAAIRILRDVPPLPDDLLKLLKFCSDYYHHPLGATILGALPTRLRRTQAIKPKTANALSVTANAATASVVGPPLSVEQSAALAQLRQAPSASFTCWLLHGVTGSGKTEIYFQLIADALARGEQILLLVPEINLTPQLEALIRSRFPNTTLALLHSGLNESERLQHWLAAQSGAAHIVLGTRLAVFAPLAKLGLIIVDEEHDASFKQMEGLRYSARDVALVRAQKSKVPIVLGSATPALETFERARSGRTRLLTLTRRVNASLPAVETIDTRQQPLIDGLSQPLLRALHETFKRGKQSLVFINRRGYSPVLACRSCGWISNCHRCSARLVLHLADRKLCCHHCGYTTTLPSACPDCGTADLQPVGQGTQRIEAALTRMLPTARILRIDRDSTRRKQAWRDMREQIHAQQVDILVGTQILAKGHDFPQLNLVGVLNADGSLYSTDFRAAERLYARLAQVGGRAGRGAEPGKVLIQTEFPGHPLYVALAQHDYTGFAEAQLAERKQAGQPPYVYQAVLRAEATKLDTALDFLAAAARAGGRTDDVTIFDPVPATLTRLAGLERAHLVVESRTRSALHAFLTAWREQLDVLGARKVRWVIDVDPLDL